jgi:hypothetical protein
LPSATAQGFPNSIAHVRESLPEALGTQGAEGFCEQELSLILLMSGKELQRRFSHVFGLQTKGLSISFSSSLRANTWKEQMETQKQMGKHIFICLMNRKNVRFPDAPFPLVSAWAAGFLLLISSN